MTLRASVPVRLALAAVVAGSVISLSGCHAPFVCRGLEYDIADGPKGSPSPQAALDLFLASGDADGFPSDGWSGPSPAGVFTSGRASVTVGQPSSSHGWFVTEAKTC